MKNIQKSSMLKTFIDPKKVLKSYKNENTNEKTEQANSSIFNKVGTFSYLTINLNW